MAEIMHRYNSGLAAYQITDAEDDPIQYSIWEKEILKYYISAHPIDAYEAEMRRWTAIEDTELEDLPDEFYIAGFIEDCHETTIKKEGRNNAELGKVFVWESSYDDQEENGNDRVSPFEFKLAEFRYEPDSKDRVDHGRRKLKHNSHLEYLLRVNCI